jgi:hypothetical protein
MYPASDDDHRARGARRALYVGSAYAALAASTAGNTLIAVPAKLRSVVRSYLQQHPHAAVTLLVNVTASAFGYAPQTGIVTLAVWTYGKFR